MSGRSPGPGAARRNVKLLARTIALVAIKVKLTPSVVFDLLLRAKSKLEKQLLRTNMRFSKYSIAILFLFLAACVQQEINYKFMFVEVSDALRADSLGYAWVCGPPPDFEPIALFRETSAFSISVFGDISPDALSDPPVIIRMGTDRSNCAFYYKTFTNSRYFHFEVFQAEWTSHGRSVVSLGRDQVIDFLVKTCASDRPRPLELNCKFIEEPDVNPRIIVFRRSQLRMEDVGRGNLHVPRYFVLAEGALLAVD